jgi:hypothetical protein
MNVYESWSNDYMWGRFDYIFVSPSIVKNLWWFLEGETIVLPGKLDSFYFKSFPLIL